MFCYSTLNFCATLPSLDMKSPLLCTTFAPFVQKSKYKVELPGQSLNGSQEKTTVLSKEMEIAGRNDISNAFVTFSNGVQYLDLKFKLVLSWPTRPQQRSSVKFSLRHSLATLSIVILIKQPLCELN